MSLDDLKLHLQRHFSDGLVTVTGSGLSCSEAHFYLPVLDDADAVQKQALGSFGRIAKEGRKYGFSLLVVSQRPSDVSRTILSQCNNFLALRLTNETGQGVIKLGLFLLNWRNRSERRSQYPVDVVRDCQSNAGDLRAAFRVMTLTSNT